MNAEIKVLALKYRPKRFEDLVGQATISQTLSLALDSNRLSHAYLFSGLRGSGKTSTARIMAKAFLCSQGPTSKPCEVCENCQSANSNRHLDIIEMDAASNRGIDDIKDLIEHTKYKPSSARFKVFIIDEVHMLTTQAFNALLKTLEEPPGFVKFILATTDPLKLPATILSRTQHFRFKKIANKDVIHHLMHILNEEQIEFENEALDIISRSGQGSLRDTLTLLDQAIIFAKGKVTTTAVVDMLGLIDPKFMDEIFEVILNKEDTVNIVNSLEEYEAGQVCDEMTIYLKQKMLERNVKFDTLLFDRFFRIIADAKHLLSLNSDPSFVLLLMLSKMSEAVNLKTIDEVINEIEAIEVKEHQRACATVLTDALEEQTVVQHSHESNTQVVASDVQDVYHDQTPTQIKSGEPTVQEETVIVNEPKPVTESTIEQTVAVQVETPAVENKEKTQAEPIINDTPAIVEESISKPTVVTEEVQSVPSVEEKPEMSSEVIIEEQPQKIQTENTVQNVSSVENSDPFATPFDEPSTNTPITNNTMQDKEESVPVAQEMVQEENVSKETTVVQDAPVVEETTPEVAQAQETVPSDDVPLEPATVVQNEQQAVSAVANDFMQQVPSMDVPSSPEPVSSVVQPETTPIEDKIASVKDEHSDKFELVINRVYDRDIELGEAFEDNFLYKSFDGEELTITSYAQGDTRKFLLKHYGVIKTFFYDVFGNGIELKFDTQEREKKSNEVENNSVQPQEQNVQETQSAANNNDAGSMIEDIEMGSGCVADMQKTANPAPSQKELQIQDVLNSPMLNKAKELFDIKKITVKTKT